MTPAARPLDLLAAKSSAAALILTLSSAVINDVRSGGVSYPADRYALMTGSESCSSENSISASRFFSSSSLLLAE